MLLNFITRILKRLCLCLNAMYAILFANISGFTLTAMRLRFIFYNQSITKVCSKIETYVKKVKVCQCLTVFTILYILYGLWILYGYCIYMEYIYIIPRVMIFLSLFIYNLQILLRKFSWLTLVFYSMGNTHSNAFSPASHSWKGIFCQHSNVLLILSKN